LVYNWIRQQQTKQQQLLADRQKARQDKDFTKADQLRDQLAEEGIAVMDLSNNEYKLEKS
jgi:cysteinyl-tRNA synthetase